MFPAALRQRNGPRHDKMRRRRGTTSRPAHWMMRNTVVPTRQPRSALKGPVLVPRARGFLMSAARFAGIDRCEIRLKMHSVRPLVAPVAGELMPRQGQLDQPLPVIAVGGCRGALHRRFGLMLRVVRRAHESDIIRPIWTSGWQFRPYECGVDCRPISVNADALPTQAKQLFPDISATVRWDGRHPEPICELRHSLRPVPPVNIAQPLAPPREAKGGSS